MRSYSSNISVVISLYLTDLSKENTDYIIQSVNVQTQKRVRTYEQFDHIMTLDMAKEISMIQRSEIGKKIRQQFISAEKELQLIRF